MPQTEEQAATAQRWMDRPVAKGCSDEPLFFDPPAQIGQMMGGREFFWSIDARVIHRVGLMQGLGWEIPYGGAKDGINYCRVSLRKNGAGSYDMLFGKRTDMREGLDVGGGIINPFGIETIRIIEAVPPCQLREVYDRETVNG